jgi:RNA polymerase sigma-70 factor (sigma-E family)
MAERSMGFEAFYRAERPDILRAVVMALDDRDLALDCVDEALVRAYERWDSLESMTNPAGWVFRVAVNCGLNRHRRRRLERLRPLRPDPGSSGLDEVADPAMARALARLSVEQRAVVILRYHLDWTVEQVATALDISAGTVKSRLHRALRRLETLLGGHNDHAH